MFRGTTIEFSLRRFIRSGSLFIGVATLTGAASGAALGGFIGVIGIGPFLLVPLAVAVAVMVVLDLAGRPLLLQRNTETPRDWMHREAWQWALFNGIALGSGVMTRIAFPIWYVLPLVAVATGSAIVTGACWGAYGGARAIASIALGFKQIRARRPPNVSRDLGLPRSLRVTADVLALGVVLLLVFVDAS